MKRFSRHRVSADPMLESEKELRQCIPEYDPAKSAEEFLARYLKPVEESAILVQSVEPHVDAAPL